MSESSRGASASFVQWAALVTILLQLLLFAAAWGRIEAHVEDMNLRLTRIEAQIDKGKGF